MTVKVQIIPTSDYLHDEKFDWYDGETHHLGFFCPHDCIKVEAGEVWCPDCEKDGQGLTPDDVDRAFSSLESGDMDDDSEDWDGE